MTREEIEKKRDEAHAAADTASQKLAEAQATVAETKRQLDGTDGAWKTHEKAKAALERRQAEFANLEAKFAEFDRQIADLERANDRARYAGRLGDADYRRARAAIVDLAQKYVAHAVEIQAGREAARRIAREQARAVVEVRELSERLVETAVVSALDEEEAALAFDRAIVEAAHAQNVHLEAPTYAPPQPLRRDVLNEDFECYVAAPIEEFERSRIRASQWRELDPLFAPKG